MYATKADLAAYLGVEESTLPTTTQRDLDIAADTINAYTLNRIDPVIHAEPAKRAQIAQYEYSVTLGGIDMVGPLASFSAGSFSMTPDGATPDLAPRARRILFPTGLLYRGVRVR